MKLIKLMVLAVCSFATNLAFAATACEMGNKNPITHDDGVIYDRVSEDMDRINGKSRDPKHQPRRTYSRNNGQSAK